MLYRQFNARAVLIKAGLVGGQAAVQWLIVRKARKLKRFFSVLNFGQSAAPGVGRGSQHGGLQMKNVIFVLMLLAAAVLLFVFGPPVLQADENPENHRFHPGTHWGR